MFIVSFLPVNLERKAVRRVAAVFVMSILFSFLFSLRHRDRVRIKEINTMLDV